MWPMGLLFNCSKSTGKSKGKSAESIQEQLKEKAEEADTLKQRYIRSVSIVRNLKLSHCQYHVYLILKIFISFNSHVHSL